MFLSESLTVLDVFYNLQTQFNQDVSLSSIYHK